MGDNSSINELIQQLETFISEQAGAAATVQAAQPLAGGASRDSWLLVVALHGQQEPLKLVLRRDLETSMYEQALDRQQEFLLIRVAYENDVLAPRPRWHSNDSSVLGAPFFLMDYVEGVSIGRQVVKLPELAEAHERLPQQMAEQIAKIHAIDYEAHALDFLRGRGQDLSPAHEALADARKTLDRLDIVNPVFEFGLRWAAKHAPTSERITLLHGDFRIGNLLIDPQGLNGVIDWEFSHLGDPLEDLAWPCVRDWRFGHGHLRLGGIGQREPYIEAYEQATGHPVDRKALDYWEIVGNLRWGATCLSQANRHLSGGDPSVELASLGRRSAEMQLEMLRLIEAYES